MGDYIMKKEDRATFNKSGNIKLGNTWNFSTVYGDEIKKVFFNGSYHEAAGTCDKCKKCFNRSATCKVIGSLPH